MPDNYTLAQISDCHLFADKEMLHHGANVYQNLCRILKHIKVQNIADAIVFTGDLTQDHSEQSYQNFVQAFTDCDITTPVYFTSGNHDDPQILAHYLNTMPFRFETHIELAHWQILLIESKSDTPSGYITNNELNKIEQLVSDKKAQLLFMHHHPIDVGYFIDRHGLVNKSALYQVLSQYPSIASIACGHVHQALSMTLTLTTNEVQVLTCPATSIQFDPNHSTVHANEQPPGYRIITLKNDQTLHSQVIFI